jgi:hypothetical protein
VTTSVNSAPNSERYIVHAKDAGDVTLPRCSLGCLTPSSRGGGCKYVLECLTKWRQQSFDVSINLETHLDKEGAFQKAFQGMLRISILTLIKTMKEKT